MLRLNRTIDGRRQENSAEHSWHVGLCAAVLAPSFAPGVDLGRVHQMLTIHDLVEIEVGDVAIYDDAGRSAITPVEHDAAARIFSTVPEGEEMHALWKEFEQADSDDARYARAVDRLQPMLMHWAGGGAVWRERGIRAATMGKLVEAIGRFWPALEPLAATIVADASARGDLDARPH